MVERQLSLSDGPVGARIYLWRGIARNRWDEAARETERHQLDLFTGSIGYIDLVSAWQIVVQSI